MKFLLCLILLFTPLFSNESMDVSQKNKPLTVKVLLQTETNQPNVEVKGGYFLYNPTTNDLITSSSRRRRGKIQTGETGLIWSRKIPDTYEIRIVPSTSRSAIYVDGIQYKGCLEIYAIGGEISIVNEVDSENYLKSILCSKIQKSYNSKVLESLAVVERTNLYHFINRNSYASWQVKANDVHYTGMKYLSKNRPIGSAVNRTRDMVLTYKKQPFAAVFSTNNAGKSASYASLFRKVWKTPPGVSKLPSASLRQQSKWGFSVKKEDLAKQFGLSKIDQVGLFIVKGSNKAYGVRLANKKVHKDIPFATFQKIFGKKHLRSNDFTIRVVQDKAYISGYGEGLGSGLCLASADIQASQNMSVEKILKSHFPKTQLINLRRESGEISETSFIWR